MNDLVRVYGHPRSGTNYLASLLKTNFFEDVNTESNGGDYGHWANRKDTGSIPYSGLYGGHKFVEDERGIYIYRDGRDVCVSMWMTKNFRHPDEADLPFSEYLRRPLDWRDSPGRRRTDEKALPAHWLEHVRRGKRKFPYFVRYEILMDWPCVVLAAIAMQFGLERKGFFVSDNGLVGPDPHKGKHVGRWKFVFSDEDLEFFRSETGNLDGEGLLWR